MGKKYERTSTKSQREADRKADQYKRDLENGAGGISKNMRVSAWAYEWLETYKKPAVLAASYKRYKRCIDNHIAPGIGGLRLCEVTDVHLQKLLNTKAGYSHSEVKFFRDTMRTIFKRARKSRLIVHDPAEDLIMPQYKKGKRRSITYIERFHFLKAAENHYAGLMFKVMLFCGLRSGEVIALSWKDIDFKKHVINVSAAMESGTKNIKAPKTEAGIRTIPIPDEIYSGLLELRGGPFDPVFTSKAAKRHTATTRLNAWNSMREAIDKSMGAKWEMVKGEDGKMRRQKVLSVIAPDFIPYYLRHTFCTDCQAKGVPLKTASYLMGHSNTSITANIYTHVTEDTIEDAARLLGVTFGVTDETDSHQTA